MDSTVTWYACVRYWVLTSRKNTAKKISAGTSIAAVITISRMLALTFPAQALEAYFAEKEKDATMKSWKVPWAAKYPSQRADTMKIGAIKAITCHTRCGFFQP